jgi:3-hydroxybutyryl-CoA dehydrogenase
VESPGAIFDSNTFSVTIMKLGVVTSRPTRVIGIHFFSRVPVLQLVELVPSLLTSDDTTARSRSWVRDGLGKQAIDSRDRAGFVVNALLVPFILSAIRRYESGLAEDIDRGLVLGAAHPQGPLALAGLIGLDTTDAIAASLYGEFKEPPYAAPPLLQRMVDAGCWAASRGEASMPAMRGSGWATGHVREAPRRRPESAYPNCGEPTFCLPGGRQSARLGVKISRASWAVAPVVDRWQVE